MDLAHIVDDPRTSRRERRAALRLLEYAGWIDPLAGAVVRLVAHRVDRA